MNNAKWTAAAIGYMCAFAYAISLMVYQFGMLFVSGEFNVWTAAAVMVLAAFLYLLFRKNKYIGNTTKKSKSNNKETTTV